MPKASSLEADLKNEFDNIEVEFIKGSGGVFEVTHNGKLIFSKKREKRFPEKEEIFSSLQKA